MGLEESDILEMAMALVCVMNKDTVREILKGEGYSNVDIDEFIDECLS